MNIKKIRNLIILVALSTFIVGCSSGESESPADNSDDNKETETEGGELNVGMNAQPPTLDIPQTTATAARDISHHIYEGLVTLNSSLDVEPMLAESYDESDDGKTITFHLREGIKFHNGDEVTADDVVASMNRWQKLSSSAQTYLEGTEYEAEDTHTVIATIKEPTSIDMYVFADLSQFAAIMPKDLVENADLDDLDEYIGTGPYQFEEWKQDQYIQLTKYADFQSRSEPADGLAGEKNAYIDDMYFHFVDDGSTRLAGLETGEYDITSIDQTDVKRMEENPDIKNSITPSAMLVLLLNNESGIFSDKDMRKAANAAINVDDILEAAYVEDDLYEKDHALVSKSQTDWHTDSGSEVYNTYDPELAKQLLKDAGYDGEEVVMLTSRDFAAHYTASVVTQELLEDVGMNVKLDVYDAVTAIERADDPDAYDMKHDTFAFRSTPIQQIFLNPEYQGWPDSEELEKTKEDILFADSLEEAQDISSDFHEAFYEDLPTIKIGNSTLVESMGENIDGYQTIAGPILWNISINE